MAGEAHHHEEGVDVLQVLRYGLVQLVKTGGEILAGNQFGLRIFDGRVRNPIVRIDFVVDSFLRQFRVELARLAVQAHPPVVVDAVREIRSLLDFGDEASAADGMDTTGRKEEHVTGMHVVTGQDIGDGSVGHAPLIFFRCQLLAQAGIQAGARFRVHHIPHLGLPVALPVAAERHRIVGMDLDGQVVPGVDELDQERELVPVPLIDMLAHERFLEFLHEFGDGPSAQGAVRNGGLMLPETGQFPTLTDMVQIGFNSFVAGDLFSAPDHGP